MSALHHLAFRTPDLERLEAFYTRTLGLRVVRRDAARGSVWLRIGTAVLMLERAEDDEPRTPAGTRDLVALAVADRATWRERLCARGVTLETETPHTLYFRDPDGRRIALSDYPLFDLAEPAPTGDGDFTDCL